jgi:hypothetical protein
MQLLVKERVQKLRQEIADITHENFLPRRASQYKEAVGEQGRRLFRLQEILDELRALTAWKKT